MSRIARRGLLTWDSTAATGRWFPLHLHIPTATKARHPEEYIQHLAGTLFPMLALSGLWQGVRPEDVLAFLDREEA
jgi:hypothetical protein